MTREERKMVEFLEAMPREDFHLKVIRGIAKREVFGALVTFGAGTLSKGEKKEIIQALDKVDSVFGEEVSNEALDKIAATIAGRSVKLR